MKSNYSAYQERATKMVSAC